jgi:cyclic pyranopterin phosphate synthase
MADELVFAFEGIADDLPYVPVAGRRALDVLGRKLSLEGWRSLPVDKRWMVVRAGAAPRVDTRALEAIDMAMPSPVRVPPLPDPPPGAAPLQLLAALGGARPLDTLTWAGLRPVDRYALVKSLAKPEKLAAAYEQIVGSVRPSALVPAVSVAPPPLPHLTASGAAQMVDVGAKAATFRRAVASARIRTAPKVLEAVAAAAVAKGDVLATARVAGIMAVKRTPELVPLCHPVATTRATVDFDLDIAQGELRIEASVEACDRTGVEMEAMVAASVAALTVYDMIKGGDRWARIEAVQLESKAGGKSGAQSRPPDHGPDSE